MSKKIQSLLVTVSVCLAATFASFAPVQVDAASRASKSSVSSVVQKAATSKKPIKKTQASSKATKVPVTNCVIKGNISDKKEKIYHLPGCPNYGQTKIDTGKGEQMFCSEADAKKAGWRKSGNCPK